MTFQSRLRACVERGNLTVADLARWFGRPYQTVRCWLHDGWQPAGGPVTVKRMQNRLRHLEVTTSRWGRDLRDLPMHQRAKQLVRHKNGRHP
jgi:hypothetical protein